MQKGINQANLVKQTEPSTSLLLYLALFFAATASAGSLFFSEVMKLPPCVLCWYQRIAMYPLVLILGVSIVRKDHGHIYYGLPLALIGLAIAIYHNLLYYKIIPESIVPCTSGISCTSRQIEWLGFITIPLMSLFAFSLISAFLFAQVKIRSSK
jgi:disulfide bond formation protein DsbB